MPERPSILRRLAWAYSWSFVLVEPPDDDRPDELERLLAPVPEVDRDFVPLLEPLLRDFVPEVEPLLRDFVPELEPLLRDLVPEVEPLLRDFVPELEPLLRDLVPE